jgi:hypothetical protein
MVSALFVLGSWYTSIMAVSTTHLMISTARGGTAPARALRVQVLYYVVGHCFGPAVLHPA